jgi:aryl-phospho-beta-D-glucosidase BglC (GH1 family)
MNRRDAEKAEVFKFYLLRVIVLIGLCAALWGSVSGARAQAPGVSDERFARLSRGIGLVGWFWYAPENLEDVAAYFTPGDFARIRSLGFTFVRVPIDLGFLMDESDDDRLNDERLAVFDHALEQMLAADLAVMVDLHSTSLEDANASNYSGALEDPEFVPVFIEFWRSFAAHLSAYDPEMVFIEPMNEPVFEDDPAAWYPIQAALLAAIRESAPEHTLIATSALWSGLDTFLTIEPLDDPNIVYNFHFYEPFLFTHQGADWTWWLVESLRGVPYPSSPVAVQPVIDQYDNEEIRQQLSWYGEEGWNIAIIDERIALAAAWADQHGVRVICNEFGTYARYAPPADRVQWIFDTRTTFEKYQIGWAMWEYDGGFGLVRRENGQTFVDVDAARALGLTP